MCWEDVMCLTCCVFLPKVRCDVRQMCCTSTCVLLLDSHIYIYIYTVGIGCASNAVFFGIASVG